MGWARATFPPWTHSDSERCADGYIYGVKDYDTSLRFDAKDFRVTYNGWSPAYHTYWFRSMEDALGFCYRTGAARAPAPKTVLNPRDKAFR